MIPSEDRRAQSEGIHDLLQALEAALAEDVEEDAWKRSSREMEWKRKKKM